jgi:uncharacterized protein YecT (DUF1311 family)
MQILLHTSICFLLSTALTFPVHVLANEKHRIDLWLDRALETGDPSTRGMREAINQAEAMWDKEMNRAYQQLMRTLPGAQKLALQQSQRNWLKFRDAERETIASIVLSQEGTMHQLTAADKSLTLVRQRTLQLLNYETLLQGEQ